MPNSYNGWSAGRGWSVANGKLAKLVVAGEDFSPGVRAGSVHKVLNYVAQQLHLRVEPVVKSGWHQKDDWGYYYRPTTGGGSLSCHASGTAFDYNATRHPYGKRNTWTEAQVREINKICAEVNNTVKCLIDHDEMHFEICKNAAEVDRAASRIGVTTAPSPVTSSRPVIRRGSTGDAVKLIQRWLGLPDDGDFGPKTEAAVIKYQREHELTADGVVGPATYRKMGL